MKSKTIVMTAVSALLVGAGLFLGGSTPSASAKAQVLGNKTIQRTLTGGTTTQPSDLPDSAAPMEPSCQIFGSGTTNEGKPSNLFGNGTALTITAGKTAGHSSVYITGSSTPLVTTWGSTSSEPHYYYQITNSFDDFLDPENSAHGCGSVYGGKIPATTTITNNLTGNTSITMTSGNAYWLVAGGGTKTTGSGVINMSGGSAFYVVGDYGNVGATNRVLTGGVTMNFSGTATVTLGVIGSATGNTSTVVNVKDSPNIKTMNLDKFAGNIFHITGLLTKESKIGIKPNVTSGSSLTEGAILATADNADYLANYRSIFSLTSAYTGTKGMISTNGANLIYTFPSTSVVAPTPTSTYTDGKIASLQANETYILTDSNGATHTRTADANGVIAINDTTNFDLVGLTISSLVQVRNASQTEDSAAQTSLAYAMPTKETFASTSWSYDAYEDTLSGLEASKSYTLYANDGTSAIVTTDENGKIDLSTVSALSGKTLTSIAKNSTGAAKVISDPLTLNNYAVLTRETNATTIEYSSKDGILTGLDKNATYTLETTAGTITIASGDSTSFDLSSYLAANNPTYLNGTTPYSVTSIKKKGDGTTTANSLSMSLSGALLPRESIPAYSYDSATGYLQNLVANKAYVFTDSNGKTYTATSDKDGKIATYDLSDENGTKITPQTTLSSITVKGDGTTSIDSVATALTTTIVVPELEKTPDSVYAEEEGLIQGLTKDASYLLNVTLSDGSTKQVEVQTNENGEVDVLDYPELESVSVTSITKKATESGKINSLPETTSYVIGERTTLIAHLKTRMKKALDQQIDDLLTNANVDDKDALTKKAAAIKEEGEKAIEELTYTTSSNFKDESQKIIDLAKEETAYEVKREVTIEKVEDLKRTCSDNEKVNAVVKKAIADLDELDFGSDPDSKMDDVYTTAKNAVNLVMDKSTTENKMADSFGKNESSWDEKEKELYDTYTAKIEAASSSEQVEELYQEFLAEKATLESNITSKTLADYAIAGYVILGLYVLFYIIYAGFLRHHHIDKVFIIAWAIELIAMVVVSLLVKASSPVLLALLWGFYIVSILMTLFLEPKEKGANQSNAH